MTVTGKVFDCAEGDVDAALHLAGAVIAQWHALPPDVQKLLVDQSAAMFVPRHQISQTQQSVEVLIRKDVT